MHICVMITTRGRFDALARLFDSLSQQTYRNFSILLGDQLGNEEMETFLARYADKHIITRHVLRPMGLSAARNALFPFINGDYVHLSDDDCYLEQSTFASIAKYAQLYPNAGALVCAGHPMPREMYADFLPGRKLSKYTVFKNCPSWCIFIKKDICLSVGEFDEELGIGAPTPWQSGEETDYLLRILTTGAEVVRCPSARVYHDAEDIKNLNRQKIKGYCVGRMYTIRKHSFPFWFVLSNIFYPLAQAIWEAPIHGLPIIKKRIIIFHGRLTAYLKLSFNNRHL